MKDSRLFLKLEFKIIFPCVLIKRTCTYERYINFWLTWFSFDPLNRVCHWNESLCMFSFFQNSSQNCQFCNIFLGPENRGSTRNLGETWSHQSKVSLIIIWLPSTHFSQGIIWSRNKKWNLMISFSSLQRIGFSIWLLCVLTQKRNLSNFVKGHL